MLKIHVIAVDIGVSFVKFGIYNTEGNCVANIVKENPAKLPKPDIFIQESLQIVNIVISGIREVVEASNINPSSIEAIGFSGAMGGILGIDREWNPIAEWSIISDKRYYPYVTKVKNIGGEQIARICGTNFPVFAPKILWWKNEFPELYKKVVKFMGIYSFVLGKLSNTNAFDAVMDKTIIVFSGLADLKNTEWSDELCSLFNIDKKRLPKIVDSATVVGYLSKEIALLCGLKQGIPLVAGLGDKPAGNLGAGMVEKGILVDEAATYGAFSVCVDKFVPDVKYKTLENLPSPLNGLYTPGAYLMLSGAISSWFCDVFAEKDKEIAKDKSISVFKLLDEQAQKIPAGSEGLLSISLLAGRNYPLDPDIKGLFIGHNLTHNKPHFYRSLLEGFAYEYSYYHNVVKNNYPDLKIKEVYVIGGGSNSDLYNQIKSDVLGIPYIKLNRNDSTLLGNMLIAGKAIGIFKDLKKEIQKFIIKTKKYSPIEKNHKIYKKYAELYFILFDKVRDILVELKNIS